MTIVWTKAAEKDLDHIEDFIKPDSPVSAVNIILEIISTAETLLPEHNNIGRSGRVYGTRELIVSKYPIYIVVYRIVDMIPQIIRVLHTSRKWPEEF